MASSDRHGSRALTPSHPTVRRAAAQLAGIGRAILLVRDTRVMLDADLAAHYGVETRALVQAVMRNRSRFPADFMLRLTPREVVDLRSQIVISRSHG